MKKIIAVLLSLVLALGIMAPVAFAGTYDRLPTVYIRGNGEKLYNADGTPNAMNAAWGGISEETEITICVDSAHKTAENLLARKAFTVSMATVSQMAACDYVGIVSGNKEPNKFEGGFIAFSYNYSNEFKWFGLNKNNNFDMTIDNFIMTVWEEING